MALSTKLPLPLLLTQWSSQLNPLLSNPVNGVSILSSVKLATGDNVINHLLGTQMQGWFLTDINAAVSVYRSAPMNDKTLTLHSSGTATVSIGVF